MTTPTSPSESVRLEIAVNHFAEWLRNSALTDREKISLIAGHPLIVAAHAAAPAPPEGLKLETTAAERDQHVVANLSDGFTRRLLRDFDKLQAALAGARGAALEEALAAAQKQRDTAAGHDGEAYLAGTYNGLDQACEIFRALTPEPSAPNHEKEATPLLASDDESASATRKDAGGVASAPPEASALPDFTDANVQRVYEILCDLEQPPDGEHWEGYAARKIVAALSAPPEADRGL